MDREALIEAEIEACPECGRRDGFPKLWDCEDCIAAVDERLCEDADRISAITRDIAANS